MIFLDKTNSRWLTSSRNLVTCNFFTSFITSNCFQGTWLISNFPFKIKFISISTFLVSASIASLFFVESLKTERFSIQEQFYTCSIRISTYRDFIFRVCYIVYQLFVFPVPVRKKVNHWFFLGRNPLTLVKIKIIFWNTCSIYDTKVRAFNWCVVLVVPWSWFTDIVRTCPNELTSIASIVTVKCP